MANVVLWKYYCNAFSFTIAASEEKGLYSMCTDELEITAMFLQPIGYRSEFISDFLETEIFQMFSNTMLYADQLRTVCLPLLFSY